MPLHFNDRNFLSEISGLKSALIVTCNMCPAVTVAVREKKTFLNFFKGPMKSKPFHKYLARLQNRLSNEGVESQLFNSNLYHHWFMCMWTSGQRKKLRSQAKKFESVIVLGCVSATKTVQDSIDSKLCKVIEGMEATGIMNATLKFNFPGSVSFENCKVVPFSSQNQ